MKLSALGKGADELGLRSDKSTNERCDGENNSPRTARHVFVSLY
ncbi:MAG TPA: hypothetical protein VNS63_08250 [Blastocatellia bacterium]|nr:hypothetical protein [Blastocatellia bacterium]